MEIQLVRCSLHDLEFIFRVTEESMRSYVVEAFGAWDPDNQRQRSDESFDPAIYSIIVVDDNRAGILVIEDRLSVIFIGKIYLLPEFQRRGIGSSLIRRIIERAKTDQKPLRLRVLRVNTAARRLYERLGFAVTDSTKDHVYLEYCAAS